MENNVEWIDQEAYIVNLINNRIVFCIDGSFFPEKSHLIAVYILASIGNRIILRAKFITIAALEYCHSYAAELYGSLGIYEISHVMVLNEIQGKVKVSISIDC